MTNSQISGFEIAVSKGLFCGVRIFVIALHHTVGPEHNLTKALAIGGNRRARVLIENFQCFCMRKAHALLGFDRGFFAEIQLIPIVIPGTMGNMTISFGQAIDLCHIKAKAFNTFQYSSRRRSPCGHNIHRMFWCFNHLFRGIHQHAEHDRRATKMGNFMVGQKRVDFFCSNFAATDRCSGQNRHHPGMPPAITVEQRHNI